MVISMIGGLISESGRNAATQRQSGRYELFSSHQSFRLNQCASFDRGVDNLSKHGYQKSIPASVWTVKFIEKLPLKKVGRRSLTNGFVTWSGASL